MVYGDNDVVSDELKPLCERFTNPIPIFTKIEYNFPENCHIKSIVRGNLEDLVWTGNGFVHTPSPTTLRCCNNTGVSCDGNSPFLPVDHTLAFIKHYTTKTANEYCNKMLRGFPDQKWDGSLVKYLIETRFFRTNKITQEKIDIFKNRLGIDMNYLLK